MIYFAYGSNMSTARLRQRVPSARALGVAVLHGHRLAFHKAGRDGSAKCDVALSTQPGDRVYGVIYAMHTRHRQRLDLAEGLGMGYEHKMVTVQLAEGNEASALTYRATHTDPALLPYRWYLEHVLRGAREHGLPDHYLATIAATNSADDPDPQRHLAELAIYA